jgi:hypothetical protein
MNIINKNLLRFTKFIDADKKTAKIYDLVNNKLTKSTNGNFWDGSYETININPSELPDFINSLKPCEFLIQGVHQTLSNGRCPEDATRAKDTFPFAESPGLLCIDSDSVNEMGIHSLEELNDALIKIEPCLIDVMKVMSTSASSYISVDGEEINGLRGIHTFIPIDSALNNESILKTLHVRSVIAGYCYAKITKAGTIKINSLIDMALCTSNQPIFEGGAILKNERISQDRQVKTFDGNTLLAHSITPLTEEEYRAYEKRTAELKVSVEEKAKSVRQQYISKVASRMIKKSSGLERSDAATIVERAITKNELFAEFLIYLETGEEITVQDILENPKKYHGAGCAYPLDESIFGKSIIYSDQEKPIIHTFAHGGEVFLLCSNSKKRELAGWEIELNDFVVEFNKTHAQVMLGRKHKIMRTIPAEEHEDSWISYEFINQEELRKIYVNNQIQVGVKFDKAGEIFPVMKDKISAWANHQNCRTYIKGVVFQPGKEVTPEYFNLWKGFAIEPAEGANIGIIKKHIEEIICANDPALIEYFYNWIAYTMQYPDRPAGTALVLRGEKGTGKGLIGHFLRRIWGSHARHISNPNHLVGQFNFHLMDACFLFADEAFYSGDKKNESILKALITEPTIMIERKGIDADPQPNYLKIFMVTNDDYAVPASRDERRYCVYDVSSIKRGDTHYFDELSVACADKKVQAAFLFEMLHRNISKFRVSVIPESRGLKDQMLHSLNSIGKWLADSLVQGYFTIPDWDISWREEVKTDDLYQSYLLFCNERKLSQFDIKLKAVLGRYLAKIFKSIKLKGDRGYRFGSMKEAISAFEQYEKIDLEIDTDEMDEADGLDDPSFEELFNAAPKPICNNVSRNYH